MDEFQNKPNANDPATAESEDAHKRAVTVRFVVEMLILLTGVSIGFFWCHYVEGISNEGNIIMMLLIIIIGLVRYIYLTRK